MANDAATPTPTSPKPSQQPAEEAPAEPGLSLTAWSRTVGFEPALHHAKLIGELERLTSGESRRLMVMMPPGSAKSIYASVLFPVWWFTQKPGSSVIAASHTAQLAEHFGRQCRALIRDHAGALGYTLANDDRAAARWQTTARGQYYATGVRGPIAGRRADLAIIDDPIRGFAESDSPRFREQLWDWFRADLVTRLKPNGRIALVMTRWHQDDLGGRLLADQPGLWSVLRLPALAETNDPLGRKEGDALWPSWESAEALAAKRAIVGPRTWAALFQQDPRPRSGGLFKVAKLTVLDAAPVLAPDQMVRAWDLAATAQLGGNDPDWTVGLKLGRDERGRFTVLDVVRLRGEPREVEEAIARAAEVDGLGVVIGLPQDPGSAGKAHVSYLTAGLAHYRVNSSRETGSKLLRAELVASQLSAGNVAMVAAAWNRSFVEELRGFPHGTKDDQVDALSRAFAMLVGKPSKARVLKAGLTSR